MTANLTSALVAKLREVDAFEAPAGYLDNLLSWAADEIERQAKAIEQLRAAIWPHAMLAETYSSLAPERFVTLDWPVSGFIAAAAAIRASNTPPTAEGRRANPESHTEEVS